MKAAARFTRGKNVLLLWAVFWSTVFVISLLWDVWHP